MSQQYYGGVPVPYTVSWSAEEKTEHIAVCPHAKLDAICQHSNPGVGKPKFGAPHVNRQRETIAKDNCDLCGKPLKNRTKVSLSHARPRENGHSYGDILQVEPLLHKECAAISMQHCPSLKRDVKEGTLFVRQVTSHKVQFAIYSEQGTFEATGVRQKAICYAKVQLIKWKDRDADWLMSALVSNA